MNKTLAAPRVRALQEPSFQHQTFSTLFMSRSLAPTAQLTAPLTRYANDGSFNRREAQIPMIR